MSDESNTTRTDPGSRLRRLSVTLRRILVDAVTLALWVVALTAIFLETGWPRWGFYAFLLTGVVLYTLFTRGWTNAQREG